MNEGNSSEAIDEALDNFLVQTMIQHYGDLLKVSRTRGVSLTLPALRKYIESNKYVRTRYLDGLYAERDGQGLSQNAVLNSLILAQAKAFQEGEHQNTKMYADEIKKIITEGTQQESVHAAVASAISGGVNEDLIWAIINTPLLVDVDQITVEEANRVREVFLNPNDGFEIFSKWAFQIQMGFEFQEQDFHKIIFRLCQEVVNGQIDRGIVCIPPRHSKTQILSIFLPLYSFCHNPRSHNIITSYADDVVAESSGYIRDIMTDPMFMKIFPAVRIDRDKRSLERWGTTANGVLHAVPTGGKMTKPKTGHLKLS